MFELFLIWVLNIMEKSETSCLNPFNITKRKKVMNEFAQPKRIMITVFLVLSILSTSYSLKAQNDISGKVFETTDVGSPFATVTLLSASDSSIVKGAITGEDGSYHIRSVLPNTYILAVSSIGFEGFQGDAFTYSGGALELPSVKLSESVQALDEVTVKGKRQVLERKTDRYVMDVAASTFQSDNILDIFQALPFVQVKGEEIAVNGKAGILILLDKVQMPGATMNTILQSMTGDEIENIEFITNPSSRYPSDVSTVIKITTKKSKYYGLTGTSRATVSQGISHKALVGTSFTYRKEKWLAKIDLNQSSGALFTETINDRVLNISGNSVALNGDYEAKYVYNKPSLRAVFDYTINDNNSIGLQSNTTYTLTSENSYFKNRTSFSSQIEGGADSLLRSESFEFGDKLVQNYSLYYNHKIDTLGKSLDVIFTYTPINRNEGVEMRFQNLLNPNNELIKELPVVRNINQNQVNIWVGQMDWELPFRNGLMITTGAKVSYSTNDTKPVQEVKENGEFVQDESFSFNNNFEENIVATYADMNKSIGEKVNLSAGLRMEYSTMIVDNITANRREVDREFLDYFPSVRIDYSASGMLQMSANYRRTIQRPGFSSLTPFRYYVDDFTINEGNPSLLPMYNSTFSVNMVLGGALYVEAAYSDQKDANTQLPQANGDIVIWKERNFDIKSYSLLGNYGYQVTNWWTGSVFAYGALMQSSMNQTGFSELKMEDGFYHTFGLENSFSLPAGLKLETTINYTGPFQYGLLQLVANNYTRIALKGSLFNNKLNYTLAATDFFRGDITGATINSFNVETKVSTYSDARRVQLGLIYKFGKNTVKDVRSKKMGNEDVVNRAY